MIKLVKNWLIFNKYFNCLVSGCQLSCITWQGSFQSRPSPGWGGSERLAVQCQNQDTQHWHSHSLAGINASMLKLYWGLRLLNAECWNHNTEEQRSKYNLECSITLIWIYIYLHILLHIIRHLAQSSITPLPNRIGLTKRVCIILSISKNALKASN